MLIYNCHAHIFTLDHVPKKFIPPIVTWFLKKGHIRRLARHLIPFTDRDLIDRYINFVEVTIEGSQSDVLQRLKEYYPFGSVDQTKFIILPMDMAYMEAGKVPVDITQQHAELETLVNAGEPIIPFIGTDPRRPRLLEMVESLHANHGFKGIKIYPPLGFYPNDKRLQPIFEYAVVNKLPVMSHCSRGGVYIKEVTDAMKKEPNPLGRSVDKTKKPKEFSDIYTDPANYDPVATQYPGLKICLAHFGGPDEWDKYLTTPWSPGSREEDKSWLSVVIDLIMKHDNIYTDISSTLFEKESFIDLLMVLLENDKIRERVLFGSDFYMMERAKTLERGRAIKLRSKLGPVLYKQIANVNPERYLYG
jgi:predicted TIM-barrel fold metal-dependent hydrolase